MRRKNCPKMYLGIVKTSFDGKNRLVLPRKFRNELGNEGMFYLYLGENGEIWGFDPKNWYVQVEKILSLPLSSEEGRKKRLQFFPRAEEGVLDSQGRFTLPLFFTEQMDLDEVVLFVGAGDHFEIWNPKKWRQHV